MRLNLKSLFWPILLFSIFIILSILLRALPILDNDFPFTMDQGRDMLDIREIVVGKNPTLIGPTTSINGVFLGPFYYYFTAIPFAISGGHPASLVYWTMFWYVLAAIALFIYFYKSNLKFAFLISMLSLAIPRSFYASRYSWNANLMPPFTILYFLILFATYKNPTFLKAISLGLICGIGMQIEAAFGVLLLPFSILVLLMTKTHWKFILTSVAAFSITLMPQIIFDLRHNFLMTKTFFGEITGQSSILLNKLDFTTTITSHYDSYLDIIRLLSELPSWVNVLLVLTALILILKAFRKDFFSTKANNSSLSYAFISGLFIVFSFCFYMFYQYDLKGWFVYSLYVPLIFVLSYLFETLIFTKNKFMTAFGCLIVFLFVFSSIYHQYQYVSKDSNYRPQDPSNLKNLLENIDIVYQHANGQPFKVYTYVPSVYDFSNQYLFWWYGTQKYGYQPADISYLPDKPVYITNNQKYWNQTKPLNEDSLTYLIIEKDKELSDRQYAWLGHFTHLCLLEKKPLTWQAEIHILKNCQNNPHL